MSLFDIIYNILIGPLQLVFEIIFAVAHRFIGHPGLAIIVLSLIMNFLVLPLYRRADAMQEAARDMDLKLEKGVKHIKKTFSGDERMMILQAYYRQNSYKPTDALKGSVSLLLEIPFFMAAYQFLAHLSVLNGISLGPITDLGAQDGLIHIGGVDINLLPILMTAINVISSAIYLKGFPAKTKVQLYAMSAFFLVFLYTSPAGLVFYWTLNNIFSLVKTIFYKLKNPRRVLGILFSATGFALGAYGLLVYDNPSIRRKLFLIGVGVLLQLPIVAYLLKGRIGGKGDKEAKQSYDKSFFLLAMVLLATLVGVLIPTALLASSPQDFVSVTDFYNPLWYIVSSFTMSVGFFLIWMRVFYWLASPAGKAVMEKIAWIMCGIMTVNYLFFGTKLGVISANLQFENGLEFTKKEMLVNVFVILAVTVVFYLISRWKTALKGILTIIVIAMVGMSVININTIHKGVSKAKEQAEEITEEKPSFTLSRNGKNVVVIMLDRGMGQYVPYMFNERPELKEQFDGFTYYSNTISHGGFTNFGTPGLFGGYEYTPVEMNKRDTETLISKHNEALKVMPAIFYNEGYEVTVCDPPYVNYNIVPDFSIYDAYPGINTQILEGKFEDDVYDGNLERNVFCYSIMKTMPVFAQDMVYNYGKYNQADVSSENIYTTQVVYGTSVSQGVTALFMKPYNVLVNMPAMTHITDDDTNTFMMMTNNLTHEPMLLQEPDYVPAQYVDNSAYDEAHTDRFTVDGITLRMDEKNKVIHYQTNMAAMLQIGKWLEYLKTQGVYDNTRIIIVADHGRPLNQIDQLILKPDGGSMHDAEMFYPLLMVKDFNAEGFETSDEFMTNADVPALAVEGLVENPTNPFTGKEINNQAKTDQEQYIILSEEFSVSAHGPNTFNPSRWYSVKDNIWDKDNWTYIDEVTTIPSELK